MLRKFMRVLFSVLLGYMLEAAGLLRFQRRARQTELSGNGRTDSWDAHLRERPSNIPAELTRLLLTWLVLLFLGAAEFAISFLSFDRSLRPLLMIPAALMAVVVAVNFMEVGKGPTIIRAFAVAAMFWLIVLLALGSMDPLTRTDYLVPHGLVD
jgi:hypothetical protein